MNDYSRIRFQAEPESERVPKLNSLAEAVAALQDAPVDDTPGGTAEIEVLQGGVALSGGPFDTINFESGATVTDAGGGRVDVEIDGGSGGGPTLLASHTTGAAETTFTLMSSIPATYRELYIIAKNAQSTSTSTSTSNSFALTFNNDSGSRYAFANLGLFPTSTFMVAGNTQTSMNTAFVPTSAAAIQPGITEVWIPQYAVSKAFHYVNHKSMASQSNVGVIFYDGGGSWIPAAPTAINRIDITINANAFATGTVFELWGVS